MDTMEDLLRQLLAKGNPNSSNPTSPNASTIVVEPLKGFVRETKQTDEKEKVDVDSNPKVDRGSGGYHAMPPPNWYSPDPPIPHPHINYHGPPPILDASNFANWQRDMHTHINSSSTELWRVIEEGFICLNPKNPTRREVVDKQLNATALHMIHMAVSAKDKAHISHFSSAKEVWDHLTHLFIGCESIQSSKFDEVNTEAKGFAMLEEENAEDLYCRLTALGVLMRDLGASYADGKWVKRKFINLEE